MGGTHWSNDHYFRAAAERKRTNRSAFAHNQDIVEGRCHASVHPAMDPALLKGGVRESRDSGAHACSNAIAVLFDVTGSMYEVPQILQQNLATLMNRCVDQGYIEDPAILVGGIGDAKTDIAPLQVGQFESGNEIEQDLGHLFLEGGGGGQHHESYELALYFLARKTLTDCFEKRGKRGYAFIIGDEMAYPTVSKQEVYRVFGDHIPCDISLDQILAEAQAKYDLYFVLPNLTSYYRVPTIIQFWREHLGERALRLENPGGISELIASTIGVKEETVADEQLADDLAVVESRRC